MCLRLFRNYVKLKLPNSKKKRAKANTETLHATKGTTEDDVIHPESGPLARFLAIRPYRDVLPFADERIGPELFGGEPSAPEIIDPSKAFFSALPSELKMEILDYFTVTCNVPIGKKSWREDGRWLSPDGQHIQTLKAVRRCNRELAQLGLRYLFTTMNLSPYRRNRPNWLLRFEKELLPRVGPWIRFATVYLDDENDKITARVLQHVPHLQWLAFDCRLQNYSPRAVDVLCKLSGVTHLSIYSTSPQLMSTLTANVRLVESFGSKLKSLDIFCDWSSATPDKLLESVRKHVPALESIYVFSTRESLLASLFQGGDDWPSRNTLKDAHFEECTEIDAWIVAGMVRSCPALCNVNISSCGGPGNYDDAAGKDDERERVVKELMPIKRPPLETLTIVHATDIEFRHMSLIPTRKLIIYDPLDQLLLGQLLERPQFFPGLNELELQYVREPDAEAGSKPALSHIQDAVARRGKCTFIDSTESHEPPNHFWL